MGLIHTDVAVTMSDDVHSSSFSWDGDNWVLRPDASDRALTGCDPNGIAQSGEEFCVFNDSAYAVTLRHDHTSSTSGHRLLFADEQDHVLDPGETVWGVRREGLEAFADGWHLQF
jgi:hypothetical protein